MNKRNRPIWDGSFYFKVVLFVDGVLLGQGDDSLLSGGLVAFEVTGDHTHDAGDLHHVLFLQAAGGGSGSADADTGSGFLLFWGMQPTGGKWQDLPAQNT